MGQEYEDYDEDEEATSQDIEEAFKIKQPAYDEMKELKKQKLKLEIEHLKSKPILSKFDREFLMGASFALAGNILGSDKW